MKKFSIILLAVLVTLAFAGCGNKVTEPENTPEEKEPVVGGWTINSEFDETKLPVEAEEAFEKAMEGFEGVAYTPVAYLGSQVVAGVNYAYICKATTVTAEPVTSLSVVTVYCDLENNAEVQNVTDVEIAPKEGSKTEFDPADMGGGWNNADACGAGLSEDIMKFFEKATEEMTGVGYEPVALLGTQVVAGMNYAILCKATLVSAEETNAALAMVCMYVDFEGNATITSVNDFEF